ncbi:MAG TPA: hypothetical protein VEQ38_12080 [Verrucomicrobiae bacterium]|nr:hypothetical protein [Verrucomicrobiae bacterium]
MGITQIVDPFYQSLNLKTLKNKPLVGQFCWIASPHIDRIPRIMEVERESPTEHYATKFKIRNMIDQDFRRKQKLPIWSLTLRETEELLLQKAKKRLAITIAAENTVFDDINEALAAREHLQEENILVLPLYGIESAGHEGGFPPVMVARIKALMYRQFFYCPYKAPVYEAVVRLDRIQPVIPLHPSWTPTDTALSGEALGFLMGMLREYFGAPEDEEMKALREIVQDALPDEAKVPQK